MEGGLGVPDLRALNFSLLAKWWWRWLTKGVMSWGHLMDRWSESTIRDKGNWDAIHVHRELRLLPSRGICLKIVLFLCWPQVWRDVGCSDHKVV